MKKFPRKGKKRFKKDNNNNNKKSSDQTKEKKRRKKIRKSKQNTIETETHQPNIDIKKNTKF